MPLRFRLLLVVLTTPLALTVASGNAAAQASPATQPHSASPLPVFDVAAIHQNTPQPHDHNSIWSSPFDSHFKAENMSVTGLIRWAFEMPKTRILNAPGWASSTYFNIDAEADPAVDRQLSKMPSDAARKLKERMLQQLLADRFQLVTHRETREMPIYALVIAKGGAKLGEIKAGGGTTINNGRNHLEVQGSNSLELLAEILSEEVGRVVVDRTGIAGRYDLALKWTPDDAVSAAPIDPNAPPSIFTALQEQLGLKLESAKGPVPVLVIDHVTLPTAN